MTLIANWSLPGARRRPELLPVGHRGRGPLHIKVDNDGDAVADITYLWEFEDVDDRGDAEYPEGSPDADPALPRTARSSTTTARSRPSTTRTCCSSRPTRSTEIDEDGTETVLLADAPGRPSHVGDASMPDYQALRDEAVVPLDGDGGHVVRRPGRGLVLPRPARVRPAVRRRPLRGRLRHPRPVQRELRRAAGPDRGLLDATVLYDVDGDAATPDEPDPTIGVWSTTDRASVRTLAGDGR